MLLLQEHVIKWTHFVILGSHFGQAYNSHPRRKGESRCRLSKMFSVSKERQKNLREEN